MAIYALNGAGKMGRLCLNHARIKESTILKAVQLEGNRSNNVFLWRAYLCHAGEMAAS